MSEQIAKSSRPSLNEILKKVHQSLRKDPQTDWARADKPPLLSRGEVARNIIRESGIWRPQPPAPKAPKLG